MKMVSGVIFIIFEILSLVFYFSIVVFIIFYIIKLYYGDCRGVLVFKI